MDWNECTVYGCFKEEQVDLQCNEELQKILKAAKDILDLLCKMEDPKICSTCRTTCRKTLQQLAYTWHLFNPSFDRVI
jgi:hypothetical protein